MATAHPDVPAAPAAKPRPRRAARLILLLVSFTFSFLVAEAALRIAGVGSPAFYQPDPHRGWALRPGAEGWQRREGEAWVEVNRRGLRDEEHAIPKPPGEVRIAILGDSCVEAIQVPVEETFWALLEQELASCPAVAGRKVQAVNLGVSGYGTAQELLTLRHEAWAYEPDLVLLAFYAGNDVRNNYRPLEQDAGRPYFVLEGEGLALDDSFRESGGYRFRQSWTGKVLYGALDRSRVLQLAKQAKGVVDGWIGAWKASRQEKGEALQELGLDNAVYEPPATTEWTAAWRVTEAMIRAMRDETAQRRVPFGVVSLTTGMQVHPDPAVREAFAARLGVPGLFYPDDRLAAFGQAEGVPVLTLARPLQEHAEREKVFLHGFAGAAGRAGKTAPGEGHWNARGHAAAAREMAGWVCGRLGAR